MQKPKPPEGERACFFLSRFKLFVKKGGYCMLFHSSSCYLAPISVCLHFKDRGENSQQTQGTAWSSGQQSDGAESFSWVNLLQRLQMPSCPTHSVSQGLKLPWALCSLFFILILLIYLFWLCCGMRDLSSWHMDSLFPAHRLQSMWVQ